MSNKRSREESPKTPIVTKKKQITCKSDYARFFMPRFLYNQGNPGRTYNVPRYDYDAHPLIETCIKAIARKEWENTIEHELIKLCQVLSRGKQSIIMTNGEILGAIALPIPNSCKLQETHCAAFQFLFTSKEPITVAYREACLKHLNYITSHKKFDAPQGEFVIKKLPDNLFMITYEFQDEENEDGDIVVIEID